LQQLKEEAGQGIVQVEEQNSMLKQTIQMLVSSLATRKAALERLRGVIAATRASVGALSMSLLFLLFLWIWRHLLIDC
jgi:hypothetical protein